MKFRHLKISDLETYLHSEEYKATTVIPITAQRVLSQVRNPRADSDDVALILAEEENGNVLAFIGLMPDLVFRPERKKVFWISCWWADSEKGKALGVPLLLAAYQATNGFLLADATPTSLAVFQKSRMFHVPEPKAGAKLFLKPLLKDVLLRKNPSLAKIGFLLKTMDGMMNALLGPLSFLQKQNFIKPSNIEIRFLSASELTNNGHDATNHFQRTSKDFKWITDFPWVLTDEKKEKRFYPFSSHAATFTNHFVIFKQAGDKIASLLMTERDGVFKLHYLFAESKNIKIISIVLIRLLIEKKAKEFVTFHPELTKVLLSQKLPFVYSRPTSYQYVYGNGFENELKPDGFQYGDGDAIFT